MMLIAITASNAHPTWLVSRSSRLPLLLAPPLARFTSSLRLSISPSLFPHPMRLHLHLTRSTAVDPSPHVLRVAAMFGLGIDRERNIEIVPPITLDLAPGQIIFLTGA